MDAQITVNDAASNVAPRALVRLRSEFEGGDTFVVEGQKCALPKESDNAVERSSRKRSHHGQ